MLIYHCLNIIEQEPVPENSNYKLLHITLEVATMEEDSDAIPGSPCIAINITLKASTKHIGIVKFSKNPRVSFDDKVKARIVRNSFLNLNCRLYHSLICTGYVRIHR